MFIYNLNYVNMFFQVIVFGLIFFVVWILCKLYIVVSLVVSNLEIDLCVELVCWDGYKVEFIEQVFCLIFYMCSLLNYQQLIGDIVFNFNKGLCNFWVLLDIVILLLFCDMVSSVLFDDFNMVSLICILFVDSLVMIKQDNVEIDIVIIIDEELKIFCFNQCVFGYIKVFVVVYLQFFLCNVFLYSIVSLVNYWQISFGSCFGQYLNLLWLVSDKVFFVENFDDMLCLVEVGVGWGIVLYYFVEECLCNGILVVFSEFYELGGIDIKVYCYYNIVLEFECSFLCFFESVCQCLCEFGCQCFDDVLVW